jgi:molecular chaperone DnaK
MVYQTDKMLREQGDKISGSDRADVENALADAKKALESNDKAIMEKAREALTKASHKLAEQMYKSAQSASPGAGPGPGAEPQPGAEGGGQKKDEGVIDAEYVDVEDKK